MDTPSSQLVLASGNHAQESCEQIEQRSDVRECDRKRLEDIKRLDAILGENASRRQQIAKEKSTERTIADLLGGNQPDGRDVFEPLNSKWSETVNQSLDAQRFYCQVLHEMIASVAHQLRSELKEKLRNSGEQLQRYVEKEQEQLRGVLDELNEASQGSHELLQAEIDALREHFRTGAGQAREELPKPAPQQRREFRESLPEQQHAESEKAQEHWNGHVDKQHEQLRIHIGEAHEEFRRDMLTFQKEVREEIATSKELFRARMDQSSEEKYEQLRAHVGESHGQFRREFYNLNQLLLAEIDTAKEQVRAGVEQSREEIVSMATSQLRKELSELLPEHQQNGDVDMAKELFKKYVELEKECLRARVGEAHEQIRGELYNFQQLMRTEFDASKEQFRAGVEQSREAVRSEFDTVKKEMYSLKVTWTTAHQALTEDMRELMERLSDSPRARCNSQIWKLEPQSRFGLDSCRRDDASPSGMVSGSTDIASEDGGGHGDHSETSETKGPAEHTYANQKRIMARFRAPSREDDVSIGSGTVETYMTSEAGSNRLDKLSDTPSIEAVCTSLFPTPTAQRSALRKSPEEILSDRSTTPAKISIMGLQQSLTPVRLCFEQSSHDCSQAPAAVPSSVSSLPMKHMSEVPRTSSISRSVSPPSRTPARRPHTLPGCHAGKATTPSEDMPPQLIRVERSTSRGRTSRFSNVPRSLSRAGSVTITPGRQVSSPSHAPAPLHSLPTASLAAAHFPATAPRAVPNSNQFPSQPASAAVMSALTALSKVKGDRGGFVS